MFGDPRLAAWGLCNKANIKYNHLKGSGVSITSRIRTWKKSKKPYVLLMNASRFGAGLNLQEGTDIILWHRLSINITGRSDMERQVYGRVMRLGMKNIPTVHRIAYIGEY